MEAFVERVCEHLWIVRAGPQATAYGAPFDVAFVVNRIRLRIEPLAWDQANNAHFAAVLRAVAGAIETELAGMPVTTGEHAMPKQNSRNPHMPDLNKAHNPDGTLNLEQVAKDVPAIMSEVQSGRQKLLGIDIMRLADGSELTIVHSRYAG